MAWINPVFDRTQSDVSYAIKMINEWIKQDNPTIEDLKGCLNVSDINRIEGNIDYIASELTKLLYTPSVTVKTWNDTGLPNVTDINRIINNINSLINSFYLTEDAPDVPTSMIHYSEINDVERILYLLKELLELSIKSFKKCNTFQSGRTHNLPLRR